MFTSAWRTSLAVVPPASPTAAGRIFSEMNSRKSPKAVSRFGFLAGDAAAAMSAALAVRSAPPSRGAGSGALSAPLSASTSSSVPTLPPSLPGSPPCSASSALSTPALREPTETASPPELRRGGTTVVEPFSPAPVGAGAERSTGSRTVSCVDTWDAFNASRARSYMSAPPNVMRRSSRWAVLIPVDFSP
ncbi:hypothetical protein I4F81_011212 [Pyropia yezoensis]|uniref:Uncharacterized protein n=1 Tax=Pyropia yezoensis TaxID=2788 RepID=A0ACC3CEL6_PYRYE|nr:hypothetical protein I4F81_011212 [Neopyropia yezoensis]